MKFCENVQERERMPPFWGWCIATSEVDIIAHPRAHVHHGRLIMAKIMKNSIWDKVFNGAHCGKKVAIAKINLFNVVRNHLPAWRLP